MKSKKSRIIIGVILGIIVLAGLFLSLVNFIVDFLWFKELNYLDVFFKELFTKLKIGIPCFIIFFIIIFIIQRLLKRKVLKKSSDSESITISKRLQNIGLVLTAIIFSIIITINIVNGLWWKILQFGSSTAFDMKDPIFKQDVSFYMFKLDLIKDIPMQIIFTSVVLLISFLVSFFIISVTTKGIKLNEQTTESKADFRQSAFGKNIESILSNLLGKNFTFRNAPQGISVKRQFSFSDVFS
ncbi:MAG: UPF0182 family protein, partial [Clostridiales Family XIII bacterium]|nr:UPF0182 family protein [Clostridiales Family XIII bacterium]